MAITSAAPIILEEILPPVEKMVLSKYMISRVTQMVSSATAHVLPTLRFANVRISGSMVVIPRSRMTRADALGHSRS